MESLTRGTHWSARPKQSTAVLLDGRGQSSPTASTPAVTSSQCDPRDLTRRLVYLAGPIVDTSDDGGGHGGSAELDGGATLATTSAAQPKVQTSI